VLHLHDRMYAGPLLPAFYKTSSELACISMPRVVQIARWLGVEQLNCLDGTCDVETRSMPLWTTKTGPSGRPHVPILRSINRSID
jgi:hypothetical protein